MEINMYKLMVDRNITDSNHKCWFSSYPMFSHLQQQKQQTNMAMMITPAITEMLMMRVWKFTEIQTTHNRSEHSCTKLTACSQTPAINVKVKLALTLFTGV